MEIDKNYLSKNIEEMKQQIEKEFCEEVLEEHEIIIRDAKKEIVDNFLYSALLLGTVKYCSDRYANNDEKIYRELSKAVNEIILASAFAILEKRKDKLCKENFKNKKFYENYCKKELIDIWEEYYKKHLNYLSKKEIEKLYKRFKEYIRHLANQGLQIEEIENIIKQKIQILLEKLGNRWIETMESYEKLIEEGKKELYLYLILSAL